MLFANFLKRNLKLFAAALLVALTSSVAAQNAARWITGDTVRVDGGTKL